MVKECPGNAGVFSVTEHHNTNTWCSRRHETKGAAVDHMAMKRPRTKFQKENVVFYGRGNMALAALQHHGVSPVLVLYASNTTGSKQALKPGSYQPHCKVQQGKHV